MQTILITGANRGLGLEFVRQYAADNDKVIAGCRQPEKADTLKELAKKYPNIQPEVLDVSDQSSIKRLADKLRDTAIDTLINNAGIFSGTGRDGSHFMEDGEDKSQSFGSLDPIAWGKVLQVNAIAPLMVTEAFIPNILKSKTRKIIMITSQMGSINNTQPGDIAYRSSKAALNASMRNIALELKDQGVTIISVHPGWVKTDMGGSRAHLTPETSVTGIRKVIAEMTLKETAQFLSYDGKVIPW